MRNATLTTTSSLSLPTDSYIYKIVQVNNSLLAAISSDDSLRLLQLETLQEIGGGVVEKVHAGVTCLQVVDHDPNGLLMTAGRDAVVRSYDLRTGGQETLQLGDDNRAPYLCLASHGTNVAVGTELSQSQATVLLWDTRSPKEPLQTYIESHNDDVTEVRFHPTQPTRRLLSGSTDGLVNIYDTAISDEDDALLQVENHGSSINRAGFLSDSAFFALSHDESFSVYPLNDDEEEKEEREGAATDEPSSPPPTIFGDLRPALDCEYIVDVIPSAGGIEAIIAAGSHSKHRLDLVPLRLSKDWTVNPIEAIRLSGVHGGEIVRSVHVSNADGTIFTAGEDGLVKAWRTSADGGDGEREREEAERPRKKKKKKGIADGGSESGRFKPY